MTDGEPETAVSASLQKIKSIKNQHNIFLHFLNFIKSQTSDSFVDHFDGHFAYLKTLDFFFNRTVKTNDVFFIYFLFTKFQKRVLRYKATKELLRKAGFTHCSDTGRWSRSSSSLVYTYNDR